MAVPYPASIRPGRQQHAGREHLYPWSDGTARAQDPTYGRIDRDIQWAAYDQLDPSTGARLRLSRMAAIGQTLQDRRDAGETVLGVSGLDVARARQNVHVTQHTSTWETLPVSTVTTEDRLDRLEGHTRMMRRGMIILTLVFGCVCVAVVGLVFSVIAGGS